MFVTWRRRQLPPVGYKKTSCRHAEIDPFEPVELRWRLTPVAMFSYRDGTGVPRHEVIWRPGVSINTCCIWDMRVRDRFWSELEQRVEELRRPPLNDSSAAVLLDRLDWLRAAIAERVRPVTDDEWADLLESQFREPAARA